MNSLHIDHAGAYADSRLERLREDRTAPVRGRARAVPGLLLRLRTLLRRHVAEVAIVLPRAADDTAAA